MPPASRGGSGRRRRTAEETRELMLAAGTELVFDRATKVDDEAVAGVLAFVRLTEVAEQATEISGRDPERDQSKVTTGSIYQMWPTQTAYQVDLLFHLIEMTGHISPPVSVPRGLELLAAGAPPREALMAAITIDLEMTRENKATYIDFAGQMVAGNERARKQMRDSYLSFELEMKQLYEAVLDAWDRRVIPPLGIEELSASLTALLDGFVMRWRVDPEAVPEKIAGGGDRFRHSLATEACTRLFEGLTEPR